MKKNEINIIYGEDSLEKLVIKTIVKELLEVINNDSNND